VSTVEWPGGVLGGVEVRCACGSNRVVSLTRRNKRAITTGVVWFCKECRSRFDVGAICIRCGGAEDHKRWCPFGVNPEKVLPEILIGRPKETRSDAESTDLFEPVTDKTESSA
jgi:hypothetical protein